MSTVHIDIHQHVWPDVLVEELRRRSQPPRLEGWTLFTSGEPPFAVNPADHDVGQRAAQAARDGVGRVVIGLSSPLGIEYLVPEDAEPLLDAYHQGVTGLGAPFAGWAAACLTVIDAPGLAKQLDRGLVGLQLPATAVADEPGYRWCSPLLDVLAERDLPLFIHPGPAAGAAGPSWWAALVPYVQQLHAAWFAFRAYGRAAYPRLRVCFTALAGLGPLHGERMAARGGTGPLMIAALTLDDAAIKALIAHGAEADVPNVFQITPLMAAAGMSGSSRGGVGSAIAGGGGGHKQDDIQARAIATIDLLLQAGANINARVTDSHGHTAKLVAYVQGRDHEGQSALFAAAEAGWDKVVKHLLDRGAEPNVRDAAGKLALDYARNPPPAGPGAPARAGPEAAASRAATVALLEAQLPKSVVATDTALAK